MTELPEWVRLLALRPHPEGGWFRETGAGTASLVSCVVVPGFDFADFTLDS